jgi:cephalosporin-C deacetylase-like acetyl esterase
VLSAGGRGVDLNASGTIDSFEGLFATGAQIDIAARDGVQQTVADLMQVVRMIQGGVDVDNTGSASLDANRVYMFGQSLGGVIGTVFMGIEPDIKAGVSTVPGGTFGMREQQKKVAPYVWQRTEKVSLRAYSNFS